LKRLLLVIILILLGILLFVNPTAKEISAGIAILLFGMIMLEEGFNLLVSGPLQSLLKRSTDKLYKTLGLGFFSTAIIQSSSLISVIIISFVSAGLIELRAGIGIIFGSNIGTTATTWLVSTLGLKIDIAGLAMPMLVFGIVLVLQKSKNLKGLGQVLAGLGFFFMGIYFMKSGFDAYKDSVDLAAYAMDGIRGLLVFTGIGILLTLILQSSSATMALILTALAVGQITYSNSLALAIGANVGTTITAIIGSFGSNIVGKRLAGAHFIFNVFTGMVALLFLTYLGQFVDSITAWMGIANDDYTFKLSIFHTLFNLLGVILMIPLIRPMVRILNKVFVSKEVEFQIDQPKFLNKSSLAYPQTALLALRKESRRLFKNATLKILSKGMNIKKKDLLGEERMKRVIQNSKEEIEVDIEELYIQKVKNIYGKIIEYATKAQSQFPLSPTLAQQFADVKLANRNIVESIKAVGEIRENINKYQNSENNQIQSEYDKLRLKISRILRELIHLLKSGELDKHIDKLEKLKAKAAKSDILINGKLNELLQDSTITSDMASSLVNDSHKIALISEKLIEAGELMFVHEDTLED